MHILKIIEEQFDSIISYRNGLLELLHAHILVDRPDQFDLRKNFIEELIMCEVHLQYLRYAEKLISTNQPSEKNIRWVEEFIGLKRKK